MTDRLEVLVGPGTVIRHGRVVAWAGPTASLALVKFLDQSLRNVGPSARGGQILAEHIAQILAERDPEPDAAFGAVGPDGPGWTAILHGPAQLWDSRGCTAPPRTAGWLRAPVAQSPVIAVGPAGSPAPRLVPHSPYDLVEGAVPGGGFLLAPREPAAAAASPATAATTPATSGATPATAATTPATADSTRTDLVDLRSVAIAASRPLPGVAEPAAPGSGPVVEVIYCHSGHPNHPAVERCARCNATVTGRSPHSGHRPPVGVLLADDGTVYRVDGDLLIGSAPFDDPEVAEGRRAPLRLGSPAGNLSPAHAEIHVSGWELRVTDRGSASGTHLVRPGRSDWERLTPLRPEPLEPGSHISLGQRVLTFVSPWPLVARGRPAG